MSLPTTLELTTTTTPSPAQLERQSINATENGIHVRSVSVPSWELFETQSPEYRDSVLPQSIPARFAVEAKVTQAWHRCTGYQECVIGVDRSGRFGPRAIVMREYGFSVENVCQRALGLLGRNHA